MYAWSSNEVAVQLSAWTPPLRGRGGEEELLAPFLREPPDRIRFTTYEELKVF
jgi:hypothetical protein